MTARRRIKQAAEIIAETFGMDIADVKDSRYQAGRQSIPVYTVENDEYCCPPARMLMGALPKGFAWKRSPHQDAARAEGRVLYVSPCESEATS
jgi:hypothetical protein